MTATAPHTGRAAIRDVAVALPSAVVATADLLTGVPASRAALLARHAGVERRHIAAPGETALDLGEAACRSLFEAHPELPTRIDILVYCTQTPDHPLPPNSCSLHGRLELSERVMAFDVPHACSAFVYALQLVHALLVAGAGTDALIVTADTYSSLINPDDLAARLLFGDGAAATWVSRSDLAGNESADGDHAGDDHAGDDHAGDDRADSGLLDCMCGTAGAGFGAFLVPAGGARTPVTDAIRADETVDSSGNRRSPAQIHMDGRQILSFVGAKLPGEIRSLLARNDIALESVDWLVFHQASAVVLDTLTTLLDADPARVFRTLGDVGNTVSASIPMTLRAALDEGRLERGQLLLLCGFGAGLSWGSALVRW